MTYPSIAGEYHTQVVRDHTKVRVSALIILDKSKKKAHSCDDFFKNLSERQIPGSHEKKNPDF